MMKKGDANVWWIIIGAVIALVVLVILMLIFTGRTTPLNEELGSCVGKGGVCILFGQNCPKGTLPANSFTCAEGGCCLGAPKPCRTDLECNGGRCEAYGERSYCA